MIDQGAGVETGGDGGGNQLAWLCPLIEKVVEFAFFFLLCNFSNSEDDFLTS